MNIVHPIILLYVYLFQNNQDYLTVEEFIESSDDDANAEEAQFMKKGKKNSKERKKVFVARNCSNRSCGSNS